MKISIAVNMKVKPVMPLTSLADNGMPDMLKVTSMPSTNSIKANIRISAPITTFSIFMNCFHPPFSPISLGECEKSFSLNFAYMTCGGVLY
jgi:hypothetical protein